MTNLAPMQNIIAGGLLACTILTVVSFRLRAMLRAYAFSAVCLALLSMTVGLSRDTEHLALFAIATVLLNAVVIPGFLFSVSRASGAPPRLQSFVRAASTFSISALLCGLTFFINARTAPLLPPSLPHALLMIAMSVILLGFAMMIMRRDILSQMVGFLTLENGISMISIITVGSLPLFIEFGVFSAVVVSTLLMSHLFRRVQELYGAPDSSLLNELVE